VNRASLGHAAASDGVQQRRSGDTIRRYRATSPASTAHHDLAECRRSAGCMIRGKASLVPVAFGHPRADEIPNLGKACYSGYFPSERPPRADAGAAPACSSLTQIDCAAGRVCQAADARAVLLSMRETSQARRGILQRPVLLAVLVLGKPQRVRAAGRGPCLRGHLQRRGLTAPRSLRGTQPPLWTASAA